MTINLQLGGYSVPQPLPVARGADTQVLQKQQGQSAELRASAQDSVPIGAPQSVEDKRYEQVVMAAKNFFKDVYAVSDTEFTIFKDSSGQYITRYTSLRDGRVTYIPEQKLLQFFENSQRPSRAAVLEIQA